MGSCYSTKASQMPQPTQPSPSPSSTTTTSNLAARKVNAGSAAAQKSRGFGYNHGKYSKVQASATSTNEISSACKLNGDASKVIPEKTQKVAASSPQLRFGFKKPSSVGKTAKKMPMNETSHTTAKVNKDSAVTASVESLKSNSSKLSQNSYQKGSVKGSYVASKKLIYTHKPSTFRPDDNKEWKMIDESESSHADNASTEALHSEKNREAGARNVDDATNANIPVLDNRDTDFAVKTTANRNDLNGNKNDMHSKNKKTKADTGAMQGSKLQTRLKKPFVKSKTFSDAHGLKNESTGLKHVGNSVDNVDNSKLAKEKPEVKKPAGKGSFLKRGFFSRQKTAPPPQNGVSTDKSSHNSPDTRKPPGKCLANPVDGSHGQNVRDGQEMKAGRSVSGKEESHGDVGGRVVDNTSTSSDDTVRPHSDDSDAVVASDLHIQSAIPDTLKARLIERAHIPKGIAPMAMLDSVETASIGSINSDDLMLEIDVDLGDYDDCDPPDELTGSRTSHTLVMRTRSTGGSCSHPRSRSNSHEAGGGRYTHSEENKPQTKDTKSSFSATGAPNDGESYRYGGRAPRSAMSVSGLEKREQWYNRKKGSGSMASASREETCMPAESVNELQTLMTQPKTHGSRRFPRTDGKPARPASFPNFSRQTSESSTSQNEADIAATTSKLHMFKPPRLPTSTPVNDEDKVTVDGFTYRQMSQDLTTLKTMLLKLKRVIQDDELGSPIGPASWKNGLSLSGSQPVSPFARPAERAFAFCEVTKDKDTERSLQAVLKENESLKSQVECLRQQVEDQDRTIHLLQQQMTKYEQLGSTATIPAASHREKDTKETQASPATLVTEPNTSKPGLAASTKIPGSQSTAKRSLNYPKGGNLQKPQRALCEPASQIAPPPRSMASTTIPDCSSSGQHYIANLLADMDQQIQKDMNSLFQNILESPPEHGESVTDDGTINHIIDNTCPSKNMQESGRNACDGEIHLMNGERFSDESGTLEKELNNEENMRKVPLSCAKDKGKCEVLPGRKVAKNLHQSEVLVKNIRGVAEDIPRQETKVQDNSKPFNVKPNDKKGKSIPTKMSGNPGQTGLPKYMPKGKAESSPKDQTSRFFKFGSFKRVLRSPIKLKSYSEA